MERAEGYERFLEGGGSSRFTHRDRCSAVDLSMTQCICYREDAKSVSLQRPYHPRVVATTLKELFVCNVPRVVTN